MTPKLGSRLPGTAKLRLLMPVSSNRRAFSKRSSFWSMSASPAGFQSDAERVVGGGDVGAAQPERAGASCSCVSHSPGVPAVSSAADRGRPREQQGGGQGDRGGRRFERIGVS